MKTLTRKTLIAKLKQAHASTKVEETDKRFLIEAFIDDLAEGFWNIYDAAKVLAAKGVKI